MIKSMTGYGSAKGTSGKLEISIEAKSVNNRYLDSSIKMPRVFNAFEENLKALISNAISRGKIDVYVSIDSSKADDIEIKVNMPLVKAYVSAFQSIIDENDVCKDVYISDITRSPDVVHAEKKEIDSEALKIDLCAVLSGALADLNEMRKREGEKLYSDMTLRLDEIEKLTALVEEISPKTVEEYRKKLESRMSEILQTANIDESRILTEAALFADRVAVNEEIVRLRSHISQLREMILTNEPVGRKIDFLVQEFNREVNTIGSKGNDADMSKIIVDLKAEIEKIREQAQNIE